MTDYVDSQGLPLDNADHVIERTHGTDFGEAMTPAEVAEWEARNARAVACMERFYALAPDYYWRAIEMERFTRAVLHDTAGANEWQEIVNTVRTRINAQIAAEIAAVGNAELDEVA